MLTNRIEVLTNQFWLFLEICAPCTAAASVGSVLRFDWCAYCIPHLTSSKMLVGDSGVVMMTSIARFEGGACELRVKTVGNGWEKPLTIFAHISFYSVGNGNGKVRNGIRSVKSGPSKIDKFE
jgi:hypothetical protein